MKNYNPHHHNLKLLKQIVPAMRYDGKSAIDVWRQSAKDKLYELLGLPFTMCDPCVEIEYETVTDNVKEIRFTFQSEEGYYVPCHLLIPTDTDCPPPVAICLQGHSKGMHISLGRPKYPGDETSIAGNRDFAIRAVKEGFAAFVMEQRCFGECGGTEKGPDCHNSSMTALLIGRTIIGERVWDIQRGIDILEKHFNQSINLKNIVCMGNSGGGTTTLFVSALEDRITAAMPSCYVCDFEYSIGVLKHCVCNYVPDLRKYFDAGDIGAMIAPRPFVLVAGEVDEIFPIEGVKKSVETITDVYKLLSCEDNFALVVGDGGHRFYADEAWPVMKMILK